MEEESSNKKIKLNEDKRDKEEYIKKYNEIMKLTKELKECSKYNEEYMKLSKELIKTHKPKLYIFI
jgi:sugar-specific transcriptional regulator TrmB